jgi:superfamily II DNA helicase RecQ
MQYALFTIPVGDAGGALEEMNRFLRSHRVLAVEKHLVGGPDKPAWAFCAEYLERGSTEPIDRRGEPKVDYKLVLKPEDFAVFSKLREVRKAIAEKEAVPAYAVFTNEQLAAMVQARVTTAAALEKIEGVGPARVGKYGTAMLAVLTGTPPATP